MRQEKRLGRWDEGIVEMGTTLGEEVERVKVEEFLGMFGFYLFLFTIHCLRISLCFISIFLKIISNLITSIVQCYLHDIIVVVCL